MSAGPASGALAARRYGGGERRAAGGVGDEGGRRDRQSIAPATMNAGTSFSTAGGLTDGRRWLAVGIAVGSVVVVVIDSTILNLALPSLVRDLGASNADLQWIVDAYTLVFAGFMLTGGSLADRFGRVRLMRIGLAIFGAASLAASFAGSPAMLTACRAVMGVGAAIISPATLSIVASLFDEPAARTRAIGVWAGGAMVGLAIGPIVGGVLLDRFWWGSVFLVNVPIVVVSLPLLRAFVPESKNPEASRLDPLGMVLSTTALAIVLWATISAPDRGWTAPATLWAYTLGAGLFAVFVLWELRNPAPLLDVRFFAVRRFVVPTAAVTVVLYTGAGFLFVLTLLLQFVHGYSPLGAGIRLVPMALVLSIGAVLSARVSARIGARPMIVAGLVVEGIGCVLLGTASAFAPYSLLLLGMLGYAVGQSLAFSPSMGLAMAAVPSERTGVAAGTNNTARQAGSALGVAVIGSIVASGYRTNLAVRTKSLQLAPDVLARSQASVGGGIEAGAALGGRAGASLARSAKLAFVHGAERGLVVTAGICGLAAIGAALLLPTRRAPAPATSGPRPAREPMLAPERDGRTRADPEHPAELPLLPDVTLRSDRPAP
jgi:EmrB/QacA subfamily drug resistance transporter